MEPIYDMSDQRPLTASEISEIRNAAGNYLRSRTRKALVACAAFLLCCGLVTVFLEGFPLHRFFYTWGRLSLLLTMGMLPVTVIYVGLLWNAWVYRRNIEKEFK